MTLEIIFMEGENIKYYVNKKAQSTGEHEVHRSDCGHLPNIENRTLLGDFNN